MLSSKTVCRAALAAFLLAAPAVAGLAPALAAPAPPTFSASDPVSPAHDNFPRIQGSADPDTTVRLYTDPGCGSAVAATGTAAEFASPGLEVTVADDSTTTFWATAEDAIGDVSACSSESFAYEHVSANGGGGRMVFSSRRDGNFDIFTMDYDGAAVAQLTTDGAGVSNLQPGWGPSGNIVYSSNRSGASGVWSMNADGSGAQELSSNGDRGPDVSPDGSRIAFDSSRDGDSDIYVMDADGTNVVQLTNVAGSDGAADWSPDGSRIAFHSSRDGDFEIYVMDADGSNVVQVTNNSAGDQTPTWSPDGSRLAFMSIRDGDWEIYSANPDGSAESRITTDVATDLFPVWSPDGTRIGFISTRAGGAQGDVYTMSPTGSAVVRLTATPENEDSLDWFAAGGPDTFPPAPPTFTATTPASPANDNAPLVQGSAEASSTVRLYTDPTCASAIAASGDAADFSSPGLSVSVADDSETTFFATATDGAGNTSACSTDSITYEEISTGPEAPTITGGPDDATNADIVSWSFTGDSGADFTCELTRDVDVIFSGSCVSGDDYDLSTESDGTYEFSVTQTDILGNNSVPATDTFVLDRVAPSSAAGSPSLTNSVSIAVTYGASDDSAGVDRVELWAQGPLDSAPILAATDDSPSSASFTYLAVQGEGDYEFYTRAYDAAGGYEDAPAAADSVTTLDLTAPAAPTITDTPTDPDRNTNPSWEFTGDPLMTIECELLRGTEVVVPRAECLSPVDFDLSGDGTYTIAITQVDAAGNRSAEARDDYTLDTTAPGAPAIGSSPPLVSQDDTPTWSFTGESGGTFTCTVRRGGAAVRGPETCSSPHTFTLTGEQDGSYVFEVFQTDAVGNESAAATSSYTLDTTAPAAPTIASRPTDPGTETLPSWSFTGEAGATFTCELTSASGTVSAPATCTSPVSYSLASSPTGTYTFRVHQTDAAGNSSPQSADDYTLEPPPVEPPPEPPVTEPPPDPDDVDRVAPDAPVITSAPPPIGRDRTPTWGFTGEAGATFSCALDRNGGSVTPFSPCADPMTFDLGGLNDGDFTFRVRQADAAGNVSPATAGAYELDTTAPEPPLITGAPESPGRDTSPTWSFEGEPNARFTCSLEGPAGVSVAPTGCTSPVSFDIGAVDERVTFMVTQTDVAGNTSRAARSSYTMARDPEEPDDNENVPTGGQDPEGGSIVDPEEPQIDVGSSEDVGVGLGVAPPIVSIGGGPIGPEPIAKLERDRSRERGDERDGNGSDRDIAADEPVTQPSANDPAERPVFDRLLSVIAPVAERATFPLFLLLAAAIFLVIQDRIDRNDPKLAAAPIRAEPLTFRSPHE